MKWMKWEESEVWKKRRNGIKRAKLVKILLTKDE